MDTAGVLKKSSGWAIAWSILLIALGIIAIAIPMVAAVAVTTSGCVVADLRRDIPFCNGVQHAGRGGGVVGSAGRARIYLRRRLHVVPSAAGSGHPYAVAGSLLPGRRNFRNCCFLPNPRNERIRLDVVRRIGNAAVGRTDLGSLAVQFRLGDRDDCRRRFIDQRIQVADDFPGCS